MRQAMKLSYVSLCYKLWGTLLGTKQTRELFTMSRFITNPMNSESRPLCGSAPAKVSGPMRKVSCSRCVPAKFPGGACHRCRKHIFIMFSIQTGCSLS